MFGELEGSISFFSLSPGPDLLGVFLCTHFCRASIPACLAVCGCYFAARLVRRSRCAPMLGKSMLPGEVSPRLELEMEIARVHGEYHDVGGREVGAA